MNGKRKLPLAAIVGGGVALVALVLALAFLVPKLGASAVTAGYSKVRVAEFVDQTVIEASGNIEAARASDLSFNGSGRIEGVLAGEGTAAAKGQVLATLDDTSESYDLANAVYKLEQARLTGNARTAELAALEVELKEAKYELTRLTAPFSGIVTDVAVEPGEYASTGTVIMSLIDRSSLKAVLQIDEIDLPQVRVGQVVEFEFDALPGVAYRGAVSRIPPVGRVTSQGLAVFDVEATIADPPAELLPGYSFSATILVSEARAMLTVPSAAVFPAPVDGASPTEGAPAAAATGLPADAETRRAALASLSEEERAALRAQFAASGGAGSGGGFGLRGAGAGAAATDASITQVAAALAVYVPGENDEPVLRLVTGVPRSDGTVEIVSGLAAGEWVLVPKSGSAAASASTAAAGANSLLPNMRFMTGGGGQVPAGPPPGGQP